MPDIRPLHDRDFLEWLSLWDGNNLGRRNDAVTAQTWARLIDPASKVGGIVAEDGEKLVGLVHYILHPTTGAIKDVCYMQDVYVAPECRQRGIARKMVEYLIDEGKKQGWARVYWLAESGNEAAQALYKKLGHKLDFTLHIMPL